MHQVPRSAILLLAAAVGLSDSSWAQEPAPEPLSREFFAARRAALREAVGGGLILLRSGEQPPTNGAFFQDQDFWYLSGVEDPGVAMVLLPEDGKDLLFVPPFNRFAATWDGARLAPGDESAERTGFHEVRNLRALVERELPGLLESTEPMESKDGKPRQVIWTLLEPAPGPGATSSTAGGAWRKVAGDPLDGRASRELQLKAKLEELFDDVEVRDLTPVLERLRGVKTAEEIAQIRASTHAAVEGIAEAMKSTEPGMYEYQVAAVARYVFSRLGAGPDAYAAIVGGGPNGCVLHYDANSRQLLESDLIVMDYGPTVHGYATDVTRTFPANGKFSAAQRKLVEDVLAVQEALIAEVKPGASLGQLSGLCRKLLADRGYRADHGPCHHVGLAVHDFGGDRLEPGMLITVEPGAYLRDEGMGCRIEDVVLVTEDGCEVLSAALPRDPDGIEALMARDGIAQQGIGLR